MAPRAGFQTRLSKGRDGHSPTDNSPWCSDPLGHHVSTSGTGVVFAKKRTTDERGRTFESLASERRTRAVEANLLSTVFIPEAAPGGRSPRGR